MTSTIRIIVIFLTIAAIMSAVAWIYRAGSQGALNSIERQNNEAARRADKSALDYDACRDAGRVWDFGAGRCKRGP